MGEKKEKINEIIKQLEKTKDKDSAEWKKITTEHKEEFEKIKKKYREKQNELRQLIQDKKRGIVKGEEFDIKLNELQDELTELEFKIYKMRIGS
ncbi:MAG: hypothetical protein ACFFDN_08190 [Candidatus Hodarchaeota archaeon]